MSPVPRPAFPTATISTSARRVWAARSREATWPQVTVGAESGISTRADVERLEALGVHAVLIGEALVTAPAPGAKIRELFP